MLEFSGCKYAQLFIAFFKMRWKSSYGTFSGNSTVWLKVVKKYCDNHYTSESTSAWIKSTGQISHIPTLPNEVLFSNPKLYLSPVQMIHAYFLRTHQNPSTHWTKVIDSRCSNMTMHGSYGNGTMQGEHHRCFTTRRVSEWFRCFFCLLNYKGWPAEAVVVVLLFPIDLVGKVFPLNKPLKVI